MTIALTRPTTAPTPAISPRAAARSPFTAPGPRSTRQAAPRTVTITVTVELPGGTPDVEAAQLADALRRHAERLTSARRAPVSVGIASPHPFTATTPATSAPTRALSPRGGTAPARERRLGVVSPSSPARRDIEAARQLARRATAVSPSPGPLPAGASLAIDLYGRRVRLDGTDLGLTYKEFELLAHLARHARRIVSRDELMASVWAGCEDGTGERTVDVHIRRVRAKLGRYRRLISTVRGSGYRLDPGSDVAILD